MSTVTEHHSITVPIFSRRWGHDDNWTFTMTDEGWVIQLGAHTAHVIIEPKDEVRPSETLSKWARNDMVTLPAGTTGFLEHVWSRAQEETLSREQVKAAIEDIAEWINATSKSRPKREEGLFHEYFG